MECMDYDSDHEESATNSPMQHSGWDVCQNILRGVSAFKHTDEASLHLMTEAQISHAICPPSSSTPQAKWTTCKNMFMAVNSFSSFRTAQNAVSPQEGESSMNISDTDGNTPTQKNNNIPLFKGPEFGMPENPNPFVSSFYSEFDNGSITLKTQDLPGRRNMAKRYSMQVESPARTSPQRNSLNRDSESRRASLPMHALSGHCASSPVRSLCKPRPAKRRKTMPPVSENVQMETATISSKILNFKSFMLLNVVIGICLSVYGYRIYESQCKIFSDFDPEALIKELNSKVYGQHIATEIIPNQIDMYLKKIKSGVSQKPLVLSLHGWTGVGKNFLSQTVSDFFPYTTVNKLLVPLHFAHAAEDDVYSKQIPEWIVSNVTKCHVNFVIIDEMDKASDGVISGVNDSVHSINNLNISAPVIFLLLSNSKGGEINKQVFHLTTSGRSRGSIEHQEIVKIFATEKPLWYTKLDLIINTFVPFLPLDRHHIEQCIKTDLLLKGFATKKSMVTDVVKEMSFFKLNSGDEFSHTGCKRVSDKVNLVYSGIDTD